MAGSLRSNLGAVRKHIGLCTVRLKPDSLTAPLETWHVHGQDLHVHVLYSTRLPSCRGRRGKRGCPPSALQAWLLLAACQAAQAARLPGCPAASPSGKWRRWNIGKFRVQDVGEFFYTLHLCICKLFNNRLHTLYTVPRILTICST